MISSSSVMPSTGVASDLDDGRGVEAPAGTAACGTRSCPRGRSLWIVTMKFMPGEDRAEAQQEGPEDHADHRAWRSACCRACRTSSRCRPRRARSRPARRARPDDVEVIAARGSAAGRRRPWPPASAAGRNSPRPPGMPGISTRKIMTAPCSGEDLVVRLDRPARSVASSVLWKSSPSGVEQLRADEHARTGRPGRRPRAPRPGTSRRSACGRA